MSEDQRLRASDESRLRADARKRGCLKRFGVLLAVLILLLLLTQTPFIYRRFQLARLHNAIEELKSQRAPNADEAYRDYKGVIHAHTMLGGHSTGRLEDVARAAKANALDFVVMTEHPSRYTNTTEATLRGLRDGTLFVAGNEFSSERGAQLLVAPGRNDLNGTEETAAAYIARQQAAGSLVFVAYPREFQSWDAGYDGLEVYNIFTNAKSINGWQMAFDALWSYGRHPDLMFARFYERPHETLRRWDELTSGNAPRRIIAVAGNDAHSNINIGLQTGSGDKLLIFDFDPYERMFRILRTHLLLPADQQLTEESLLDALRQGHTYFSFDLFADASGFRFTAEDADEKRIMGDEIKLDGEVRLKIYTPQRAQIKLFQNGALVREVRDASAQEFVVNERGVYRVEIYLPQLEMIKDKPWIVSNPIYVR